jgi:hypothetical protein
VEHFSDCKGWIENFGFFSVNRGFMIDLTLAASLRKKVA